MPGTQMRAVPHHHYKQQLLLPAYGVIDIYLPRYLWKRFETFLITGSIEKVNCANNKLTQIIDLPNHEC